MRNVKVVIGSNFGDEGKGLMTDYFANAMKKENGEKVLVICTNGGAQRSHTVESSDGSFRHAFRHIGSGTYAGADTFLLDTFIVNPIVFCQEMQELKEMNGIIYIDSDCRLTFPCDMMLNQIIENRRKENKHGSCGFGIYETILRNNSYKLSVGQFQSMEKGKRIDAMMEMVNDYAIPRLKDNDIDLTEKELALLQSEEIMQHYIMDFDSMCRRGIIIKGRDVLINSYSNVIFENAQGLLLDCDNLDYYPNLTPTNTGIMAVIPILKLLNESYYLEICYVSRSYMTRHGAGRFDSEYTEEEYKKYNLIDQTNVQNIYQGKIRYGHLRPCDLYERIENDLKILRENLHKKYTKSIAITHTNVFDLPEDVTNRCDIVYESNGKSRESVKGNRNGER